MCFVYVVVSRNYSKRYHFLVFNSIPPQPRERRRNQQARLCDGLENCFFKEKKRIILHPVFLLRLQYFNLIDVLIDRTYMFWLINSFQNYKLEFYRYTISIRKFPQRVTKDKKSIMTHYFFFHFHLMGRSNNEGRNDYCFCQSNKLVQACLWSMRTRLI